MIKIRKILISQPEPTDKDKSPYKKLEKFSHVKLTFKKFFKVERVSVKEFRQERINISDYSAIIFTSQSAVNMFFEMAEELRVKMPATMKYFCSSENIALYLQRHIQFRKRKVFFAKNLESGLSEVIFKHKEENYLLPCGESLNPELEKNLESCRIKFTKACLFKNVPDKISSIIDIKEYDMLVFYSPFGIKSLFENYPNFKQGEKVIATYGNTTTACAQDYGLKTDIVVSGEQGLTIVGAIEEYLEHQLKVVRQEKKQQKNAENEDAVEPTKASAAKKKTTATPALKKNAAAPKKVAAKTTATKANATKKAATKKVTAKATATKKAETKTTATKKTTTIAAKTAAKK